MLTPPPPIISSVKATKPPSPSDNNVIRSIFSYDSNIMLAAVISLLLVILFVLLLHIYAKWFLSQARQRTAARSSSIVVPHVLGARINHHFPTLTVEDNYAVSPTKGLELATISAIPLFVFSSGEEKQHQFSTECVVCLSVFEEGEIGKRLPKCDHIFHVECIDMWLRSHTTCPICRTPVIFDGSKSVEDLDLQQNGIVEHEASRGVLDWVEESNASLEIIVEVPNSENESVRMRELLSSVISAASPAAAASSSGGSSLKRMLSRNKSERKVHPAEKGTESHA